MFQNRKSVIMKKLTIILSILIIITIALGITYFSIIGFNQKDRLTREIKVASQTDIENLNTNTKTKGQYKIIEKDLKQYFYDMKYNLKTVIETTQDSRYTTILKIENLKYDGPDFEESLKFLDDAYERMKTCSLYIKNNLTEADFQKRMEGLNLDKEYQDLYMQLVKEYILNEDENMSKSQIETSILSFNKIIVYQKKVLEYLKLNKAGWGINEDTLVFYDTSVMLGYTTLVNSYKYTSENTVIIPKTEANITE